MTNSHALSIFKMLKTWNTLGTTREFCDIAELKSSLKMNRPLHRTYILTNKALFVKDIMDVHIWTGILDQNF